MFELHTPGRIFYLSAQSQDDMQSWVGMLQTLKQYHKSRQPRSIAPHVSATLLHSAGWELASKNHSFLLPDKGVVC